MKNLFSLENKYVVVFGGAGYIGRALVEDMLEMGAKVVVADAAPQPFTQHANCRFVRCDMRDSADITNAYDACANAFGKLNAMVNLVYYGKPDRLESAADEDIAFSLDGSAGQAFRAIREVIPYFEKEGGVVVNTASMYGLVSPDYRIYGTSGQNNPPTYGMGKAAVVSLTQYAAAHLASKGIRVNCVAPGPVPDPGKAPPPEFMAELAGRTMLGRVGSPHDMSGAFIYLLSDAAAFTTAECIVVDGGWTKW